MKRLSIHALGMLAFAASFFMPAPQACADTINLTLLNANQSAAGEMATMLDFDATVSAPITNTGAEYLNGDSFTTGLALDDTGYINGFPLSLAPGQSYTGLLFTIFVPASTHLGSYTGTFSLLGGPTDASLNALSTVAFDVNVTPEPPSLALLATGLVALGIGFAWRERRLRPWRIS